MNIAARVIRKLKRLVHAALWALRRRIVNGVFVLSPPASYRVVVLASQEKLDNYYHFILDILYPLYTRLRASRFSRQLPLEIVSKRGKFTDLYSLLLNPDDFKGGQVRYQEQISLKQSLPAGIVLGDVHFMARRPHAPDFIRFCNFMRKRMALPARPSNPARSIHAVERPRVLVIKRPASAPRCLLNHAELMTQLLAANCFLVEEISLEALSYRDQALALNQVGILIAPHGAGSANMIYLPPQSLFVEIVPFYFSYDAYRFIAEAIGIRYVQIKSNPPTEDEIRTAAETNYPDGPARLRQILASSTPSQSLQRELHANIPFKKFIRDVPMTVDAANLCAALGKATSPSP